MPERATKKIRSRSRGRVSSTLEQLAEEYRRRYPARDCRWVYDPTHRPELSNVMSREADGYERVTLGEMGMASTGDDEEKAVRMSDLIMMSVDKETKAELVQERDQLSRDQMRTIQREFYDQTEQAAASAKKEGHSRLPSKPIGSVTIEEREHQYDVTQREGEE